MVDNTIKLEGYIEWKHLRDGAVVASGERKNIITTVGKNALATLLNSASAGTSIVTHIGLGSGTNAVAVGDTTLTTELSGGAYARLTVTRSNPSANQVQYVATFTGITNTPTINEAGLFNAVTAGTLFAHQLVTPSVTLSTSADSLQITWTITIS